MFSRSAPVASEVLSLKQCCINCVIKHRDLLWDVGYVDTDTLRQILPHCSAEQLALIEDETREHSGRDLSWHTWHYWYNHYLVKFRKPSPDVEVPLLPGEAPVDYMVPHFPGLPPGPPGDWRAAYDARTQAEADRAELISSKLRQSYKQEATEKTGRRVGVCNVVPQQRRRNVMGGSSLGSPPMKRERGTGKPATASAMLLKAVGRKGPAPIPMHRQPPANPKAAATSRPGAVPLRKPQQPRGNFGSPSPALALQSFAAPSASQRSSTARPAQPQSAGHASGQQRSPHGVLPRSAPQHSTPQHSTPPGRPPPRQPSGGVAQSPGAPAAGKQAAIQAAAAAAIAALQAKQAAQRSPAGAVQRPAAAAAKVPRPASAQGGSPFGRTPPPPAVDKKRKEAPLGQEAGKKLRST